MLLGAITFDRISLRFNILFLIVFLSICTTLDLITGFSACSTFECLLNFSTLTLLILFLSKSVHKNSNELNLPSKDPCSKILAWAVSQSCRIGFLVSLLSSEPFCLIKNESLLSLISFLSQYCFFKPLVISYSLLSFKLTKPNLN